jgi:hypothetical protein
MRKNMRDNKGKKRKENKTRQRICQSNSSRTRRLSDRVAKHPSKNSNFRGLLDGCFDYGKQGVSTIIGRKYD